MTTAERLKAIAENEVKVFEAGKSAENDEFWNMFQDSGNRTKYSSAFADWSAEYIRPKYKVVPTHENGLTQMFNNCKGLKKIEAIYFDLSKKPQNLTSTNSNLGYYYTFSSCVELEEIEDIGMIAQNNYYSTFASCYKLHTIAKMGVDENTKFSTTFSSCRELVNLTIDGTIGQSGFNIQYSTKLSAKSLYSIIKALSATTTGLTITLPATSESNYNANPPENAPSTWSELVATKGNWTIAYA